MQVRRFKDRKELKTSSSNQQLDEIKKKKTQTKKIRHDVMVSVSPTQPPCKHGSAALTQSWPAGRPEIYQ